MEKLANWWQAGQGRFILLLPAAMATGILAYFHLKSEPSLGPAVAVSIACLVLLIAAWRIPPARFLTALILAASLGFTRATWHTAGEPPLLDVPFGAVTVTGTIASLDNLPTGRRVTLTPVQLNGGPPLARALRIKLGPNDDTALATGDAITLRAVLFKPDRPAYPGGWDSTRDAFFAGLGASGFELGQSSVTQAATPGTADEAMRRLRERIAGRINATLPPDQGAVAVTLLTGMQSQMPPAERQNFIAAGLAHLLAVAGLHVGIVMGLVFAATRFALTRHERTALHLPVKSIAAIAALAAGAVYAVLTGAHLPILRSLAMACLVTAGILAGRRAISLRGLSLAALALLIATPDALLGVSFQMSFSAVLALICGYEAARSWFARLHEGTSPAARAAAHIAGLFFTSLLAGGASMPFAAYQFGQVQPYWILANLIAVPLTALWVMPAGLLALLLMPVHLSWLALVPMGWGIAIIISLTNSVAAWPDAMLRVPAIPDAAILCYTIGLLWLCLWRSPLRLAGLAGLAVALLIYTAARPPDILVSADARLIAFHTKAGAILLRQPKASAFTLAQWQDIWPNQSFAAFDPAGCAGGLCQVGDLPAPVAIALTPQNTCPPAGISLSPIPQRAPCGQAVILIDRLFTYRNGATSLRLTPAGPVLLTDRIVQGQRPWVPPWPTQP